MQLDDFLFNLHFDIDKVRPVDAEVDWDDAPLPFKLYQGLPAISLPPTGSLEAIRASTSPNGTPSLEEMGTFFWHTYGLTQLSHVVGQASEGTEGNQPITLQTLRRYAPSGGALYPSELYAYLHTDEIPSGLYHYDVAHHRLVLLRAGDYNTYLEPALGHRCDIASAFGVVFISTMFWKNYFKYHDFSYRLQGLDSGALIGQLLQVAEQCGYVSSVHFQFLDRAVNHLLGLRDQEESVYAVIPLKRAGSTTSDAAKVRDASASTTDEALCREIPPLNHRHYEKSPKVTPYPILLEANRVAMLRSTDDFPAMGDAATGDSRTGDATTDDSSKIPVQASGCGGTMNREAAPGEGFEGVANGEWVRLPQSAGVVADFATACRQRFSPGFEFVSNEVSLQELATVLRETMCWNYASDVHDPSRTIHSGVQLAACVHGVDGIPDGAYLYDPAVHALRLHRPGDVRMELQLGLSMPTVNLFQVPLCLHLVGSRDFYRQILGTRGYRILQMEVGILLQRLLLTLAAMGLGGHPLLDYDEVACDQIYGFDSKSRVGSENRTCLIQVPVGRFRKTFRLEGGLRG